MRILIYLTTARKRLQLKIFLKLITLYLGNSHIYYFGNAQDKLKH